MPEQDWKTKLQDVSVHPADMRHQEMNIIEEVPRRFDVKMNVVQMKIITHLRLPIIHHLYLGDGPVSRLDSLLIGYLPPDHDSTVRTFELLRLWRRDS